MLKKASILLPLFFSFWTGDVMGQLQNDTVNKVNITVRVKEKPALPADTPDLKQTPKKKTRPNVKNRISAIKKQHTSRADTIGFNMKTDSGTQLPDSPIKIIIPQKSNQTIAANRLKAKKNTHFLVSLLLIVTGTLLAVFYRSGIPLVIAILLLVAGYYILIYTLVFMT